MIAAIITLRNNKIAKMNFVLLFIHCKKLKLFIENFSKIFAAVIPVIVAQSAPKKEVPIIIAGSLLPEAALIAIAVAGIKVNPAVLIVKKVHIALVAVPLFSFSESSSSIAFNPNGVAALPSPSIFADIFIIIEPTAG